MAAISAALQNLLVLYKEIDAEYPHHGTVVDKYAGITYLLLEFKICIMHI